MPDIIDLLVFINFRSYFVVGQLLKKVVSQGRLIGSRIIESATYCNQILLSHYI
jgi:hypothetical protein